MRYVLKKTYCTLVEQKYTGEIKVANFQKEAQTRLAKGLLDLIVLQFLDAQPMHGYQIIMKIRRSFGVYFGPSTVYPLLALLEKKGTVESHWDMKSERPRKVYELTSQGKSLLTLTEKSLNLICKRMASSTATTVNLSTIRNMNSVHYQKGTILSP
jgi:PadR family transcriptional regulator PadR